MLDPFPGLSAEFKHTVSDVDTAAHWGSGGLPVFSTPALVGLMESTAVIALRGHLPPGRRPSVGTLMYITWLPHPWACRSMHGRS